MAATWSQAPAPNGGTPPTEVTEAARLGLSRFLKDLPPNELGLLDLANQADAELAELGTPFREFTIAPQQILRYDPAIPLDQIVVPLPIWHFPVLVNGETRTLLSVGKLHDVWVAVRIGWSGIAKSWIAVQHARPSVAGHANIFVRVIQARADFVMSTKDGAVEMIPLSSAGTPPGASRERLDPADVLESLQLTVRMDLEAADDRPQ